MRGRSLHVRSLVAVGLAASAIAVLLVLGFGSSAVAANLHPGCNNFLSAKVLSCHFSSSFADDDFCGTGQTVVGSFDGRFTVPLDPDPGERYNNSESSGVLTNPATGATALIHSGYRFVGTVISGDPNGAHTEQWVFKGAAEVIRTPNGGVIARDAGNLVVVATFNADGSMDVQIVSDNGGHPLFATGDCGVLVSALGLA